MRRCALLVCVLASAGCARSAAARGTGWWRVTTDHVRLTTDVDHDRAVTAAWAFEDLARALSSVFPVCGGEPMGDPFEVTMLECQSEYAQVTGVASSGTYRRAQSGLIAQPARLVVPASLDRQSRFYVGQPRYTQLFLHELTRRFARACFESVPPWLEEGMASFFETLRVREHEIEIGIAPYRIGARGGRQFFREGVSVMLVSRRYVVPPSRLFQGAPTYASAWALVHMLELGPDPALRERFLEGLGAMHARQPSWLYGQDESLDAAFATYVSSTHLLERRVAYDPPPLAEPIAVSMSTAEGALVLAALELGRAHDPDRGRIDAYLAIAREDPETRVRAELMRLQLGELHEGETPESVVDALVAAHPDDRAALVARAFLALRRVRDGSRASIALAALADRTDLDSRDRVVEATLALELGDWDLALAAATEAARRDPGDVEAARAVSDATAHRRRRVSRGGHAFGWRPGGGLTPEQWEHRRPWAH